MKIIEMNIDEVIPYDNNPRKNDNAVDKVAESLERFGFQQPIVVDENNVIIIGHTRHRASKMLGYENVPVLKVNLSAEKVKALRLADNKVGEFSIWDEKLLIDEIKSLVEGGEDYILDFFSEVDMAHELDLPVVKMCSCPKCKYSGELKEFK